MNRFALPIVAATVFFLPLFALAQDGSIHLGPEEIVRAGGGEIVVPGYSVPSFEDWNNDGLGDLIVGEGGGWAPGKVRVYLNVGTETDPCFADSFYAQSEGADLTCPSQGCLGCFPRVVYWDEDARKDLLVGQANGTVRIFRNVADNNEPAFDAGAYVTVRAEDRLEVYPGNGRATPVPVDWDSDGMLDLVVGAIDGTIHFYQNCGCGGAVPPHFYFMGPDGLYIEANGRDLQVTGMRASPVVMDFDGDGRKDLISGNTNGTILFYPNVGLDSQPVFASHTFVESNGEPIDLPGAMRSRPSACYWTGAEDGYWDLLVGYGDGKVRLYRGVPKLGDFDADGMLDGDDFTFLAMALDQPVPPEGSPADLNGDGAVDDLDLRLFADLWLAEYAN